MWYNLKTKAAHKYFEWRIRSIMRTGPMPVIEAPWSVVSLIVEPRPQLSMYILSMKSFYRKLGRGRIVVLTDKKTHPRIEGPLSRHFPGIEFAMIEEVDPGKCQRGGTWERLVYLIRRSEKEYVIQMDSDTLCVGGDVDEVTRCISGNISFTYADNNWSIKSLAEISAEARADSSNYVGDVLERKFDAWPDKYELKYVRGSSGFSGFAKGQFALERLEMFHELMKWALGDRWREWGTEQSASNFMIANSAGAVTLPFPEYATFPLPVHSRGVKLFHFIGSNRFRDNYFADEGRRLIKEL
jgi:hypothetical protein